MLYRVVAADAFSTHRQFLWDLCYRVTGSVADADRLLRESFAKAVERPLPSQSADWRPHLTRSAALLAIEAIRQRKRRYYIGPWLPSPIETGSAASPVMRSNGAGGPRYDIVESGSMAFLRALETLEPRERLVLVMCDAFGLELHEVTMALEWTAATVKLLLQAARRKMQRYDAEQSPPTTEAQADVAAMLHECLSHLQHYDSAGLEKILTADAQALFDSAGEFVAPTATVVGAAAVTKVLTKFADGSGPASFSFRMLNGLPAALGQSRSRPRWANRFVLRIELREGLISEVHVILATSKLVAVRL